MVVHVRRQPSDLFANIRRYGYVDVNESTEKLDEERFSFGEVAAEVVLSAEVVSTLVFFLAVQGFHYSDQT